MDTPVMVYLGDKDLVSITVHASIDLAGSEVMRVRYPMRLNPTDSAWIAYENFILMEGVTLVLSPNFCTLTQVLSCLPHICK